MEPEPEPDEAKKEATIKRWYIAKGSKTHPCNPWIDAIRVSLGAERLPFEYSGAEFDLKWCKRLHHVDWTTFDGRKQLVNWVRGSCMLTEKEDLARSLRRYSRSSAPATDVSFHPRTYILADASERRELLGMLEAEIKSGQSMGHLLIVKPGSSGSQGRGIAVHDAATVLKMMGGAPHGDEEGDQLMTTRRRLPEDFIVQEYVDRPLLVEGRKFDLRCYACILATQPSLHVVYWPRGYLRQAMTDYTTSDLSDRTAHLTNVKVMRENADFEAQAEGAIWDFDRLQAYLTAEQLAPADYVGADMKSQMRNIMTHCFLSIESEVSKERGQFQLLGFDLMVDVELKVHLLEVNYNPSLSTHTSVLQEVIPPVLREVVGMALEVHTKQQSEHDAVGGGGEPSLLPLTAQVMAETLLPLPHCYLSEFAADGEEDDEINSEESGNEA